MNLNSSAVSHPSANLKKEDLITFRASTDEDIPFIFDTWLRGLRFGNDWYLQIPQDIYFKYYRAVLDNIFKRPGLETKIACLKEDSDVILGYVVFEPEVLHYVFVKPQWRKIGLARDLCPKDIRTVTHLTKVGRAIKPDALEFNPFLISL